MTAAYGYSAFAVDFYDFPEIDEPLPPAPRGTLWAIWELLRDVLRIEP